MDQLKVAAVQYPLEEGLSFEKFQSKVESYVLKAQALNCDVVVFPELITTEVIVWKAAEVDRELLRNFAEFKSGKYFEWLGELASKLRISILGGTSPRFHQGKIFNTAVMALPSGQLIFQDKVYLTPAEKEWGWSPGKSLSSYEAPWGRFTIATCFDCEFPSLSQALSSTPIDVLFVPSWTSSIWGLNRVDWTSKARAIEHYTYVVKTGTVPHASSTNEHFGQATIVSPQDEGFPTEVVTGAFNIDSIVTAQLDFTRLRGQRGTSGYNPSLEQRKRIVIE